MTSIPKCRKCWFYKHSTCGGFVGLPGKGCKSFRQDDDDISTDPRDIQGHTSQGIFIPSIGRIQQHRE